MRQENVPARAPCAASERLPSPRIRQTWVVCDFAKRKANEESNAPTPLPVRVPVQPAGAAGRGRPASAPGRSMAAGTISRGLSIPRQQPRGVGGNPDSAAGEGADDAEKG